MLLQFRTVYPDKGIDLFFFTHCAGNGRLVFGPQILGPAQFFLEFHIARLQAEGKVQITDGVLMPEVNPGIVR